MKQEPVAWMLVDKDWNDACRYFSVPMENAIPLYTAPRELSDKEINQVFDECYPNNGDGDVVTLIDFARAILRKASEK